MRLVLNVIWFILAGFWMAVGYAIAALIMFILIITIPFGVAALRIGIFALWPFGKTVVRRPDAGAGSAIGNVIWFVLAGWWLILLHVVTGVLLCLTIIGIPLGLANFKLIGVTLVPSGATSSRSRRRSARDSRRKPSCTAERRARALRRVVGQFAIHLVRQLKAGRPTRPARRAAARVALE